MPPRIMPILQRLRQDHSALLQPAAIEAACRQEGYTWRTRLLDPVVTISVRPPGPPRQHRLHSRRPVRRPDLLRQRLLPGPQAAAAWRLSPAPRVDHSGGPPGHRDGPPLARPPRLGHGRIQLLDARHRRAPGRVRPARQPAARLRLPGGQVAGFVRRRHRDAAPLIHRPAPLRSHEMSSCVAVSEGAEPGDIVMGDRGLSSYAHLAILAGRGLYGLFRLHQRRAVDTPPVGPRAGAREFDSPAGLLGSRWSPARGESDQIVVWHSGRKGDGAGEKGTGRKDSHVGSWQNT